MVGFFFWLWDKEREVQGYKGGKGPIMALSVLNLPWAMEDAPAHGRGEEGKWMGFNVSFNSNHSVILCFCHLL